MAKVNKGNYVVDRGLLFHYDQVEGQKVCQLCVPECKRNTVRQLAHDSVFGGHLAERKTRERIRLSFHWPKLRQSVKAVCDYVSRLPVAFETKNGSSPDCSNNSCRCTVSSVEHGLYWPY